MTETLTQSTETTHRLTPASDLSAWRIFYRYWLRDHAWVRVLLPNTYPVDEDLWRSNHPGRRRMEQLTRNAGIRSILSLRGDADNTPNILERAAADDLGLSLRFIRLRTASLPPPDTLLNLVVELRTMPKPMLVHCKSGADRTGLAVTLYLHVIKGRPLDKARRALSWRYGHFQISRAGIVHRLLDTYAAAHTKTGIGFEEWVHNAYDPTALSDRVGR